MKTAIVIGATSGIGYELTRLFLEKGYRVLATGRRINLLNDMKMKYPDQCLCEQMDITDTASTVIKLELFVQKHGQIDLFVICSGTGELNPSLRFSLEEQTIRTNVIGFTNLVDWIMGYFYKQNSGHLVAISSLGGLRGNKYAPSYSATKAFQMNYLEGMRQKIRYDLIPVYVTDIRPGFVDTEMARGKGMFWKLSVERAASRIMKAIAKKRKVSYLSFRWGMIARLFKVLPGFLYERM